MKYLAKAQPFTKSLKASLLRQFAKSNIADNAKLPSTHTTHKYAAVRGLRISVLANLPCDLVGEWAQSIHVKKVGACVA